MLFRKTVAKRALSVLLALAILVASLAALYGGYVVLFFERIEDGKIDYPTWKSLGAPKRNLEYSVISYNVGYAGILPDAGEESRASSEESVKQTLEAIAAYLKAQDASLTLLQEVDTSADRSYHINESDFFYEAFDAWNNLFSKNRNSPFEIFPLNAPKGAVKSGILTSGKFSMVNATRRSLPLPTGYDGLFGLDTCYSATRISLYDGTFLVVYNVAFNDSGKYEKCVREQLAVLLSDMRGEYEAGNYCIAAGDFGFSMAEAGAFGATDGADAFACFAEAFDGESVISAAIPFDGENPVPSYRFADGAYDETSFVATTDGFLLSPNVERVACEVLDTDFAYSDHNPVKLTFKLLP